jgi:hypothetical protein
MKTKPEPKRKDIEELPDAWERFEKAFDTVMKANPKPLSAKKGRRTRTPKRSGNRLIPRDDGSIAALRELGDFAIARPEFVDRINRFLEVDAPLFRCQVDRRATKATGDLVAVYQPSDRLNSFLAALRAGGDGHFDDPLEITTSHRVSPLQEER